MPFPIRRIRLSCSLLLAAALPAAAGTHPRLLIDASDLPRIRHACGVAPLERGPASDRTPSHTGKFGARAAQHQILRATLAGHLPGERPLPAETLAAAFLHALEATGPGAPGGSADLRPLQVVTDALAHADWALDDPLELVIALDWTWTALEPAVRREFLLAARDRAEPLTPADSPLEPRRFRARLAALALALCIDEADDPSPSWRLLRNRLLEDGRKWARTTLPTFIAWRGMSPTGSAAAAGEEADTVLAVELASLLLDSDGGDASTAPAPTWQTHGPTLGRWLEHYLLATAEHPALQSGFLHDDGTHAPSTPALRWNSLLPATAHLLAARTRDPSAVAVARRVGSLIVDPAVEAARPWSWAPILFDVESLAAADPERLPAARHLGGAVVFRGGAGLDATIVRIDAAQPYLRRRQHFDAGHFSVRRGGHLAGMASDDVSYEATASQGGGQFLGDKKTPFDYEQFYTATIAHNALICWDAARVQHWYGKRYLPVGGQRCIENTCTDFETPLAAQGRLTGHTLAYGQQDEAAYLALDLAAAYDRRALSAYTREFIFFWGRTLLVVDRVTLATPRSPPTWVLNLPGRPTVDGQPLADTARLAGSTNDAGWWRYDAAEWVRWTDRDGALWFRALHPQARTLRIAGGPAERLVIPAGPHQGKTYAGGAPAGFERLILPADRRSTENAWYRLGAPVLLGPDFGRQPHWGRVEVEPLERTASTVFITLLITDRATAEEPPRAEITAVDESWTVRVQAGADGAVLHVPRAAPGGALELTGRQAALWKLPTDVQPDPPLLTRRE